MTTLDRLQKILVEHLGVEPRRVTEEAVFYDLGTDSLDGVEICIKAEEEFGIEIDDGEWWDVTTVGDAVKLIDRLAVPA